MAVSPQERSAAECARVREWLPEYDYGGPGAWTRWRVSRHLVRCRECARELSELRRATRLLEALPDERAPAGLWTSLEQAIARVERAPARPHRPLRWAAAMTAAAAALAAGVGVWQQHTRAPLPPPVPAAAFVRSHLTWSHAQPLVPGAGLDALVSLASERETPWNVR